MTTQTRLPFDWSLVRSFLAVLQCGSLLAAAKTLHTSQPTLGRHMAELESQLGVVLFERTGRGLVPTAIALDLADAAQGMADGADQMARRLTGAQSQSTGTVRITASTPVAVYLLPVVLAEMRQALPGIQIELVASNTVSNLLRREADIAVRMVRPKQGGLIAKKIGDVAVGAYAHRAYLARSRPITQTADLAAHELIGGDTDTTILNGFKAMGFAAAKEIFVLRTDDYIVQWQALRAGLGIGFVPGYMAGTDPEVVAVLPELLRIPPLSMWLVVHREIHTSPRIRAVYDFLSKTLTSAISTVV
ncbi:MAG: LysR family transcriptional regulator [Comamonadaceae bacterium]|nr:LysR family transcriptional regulator [Comamonadaceae bacterium]